MKVNGSITTTEDRVVDVHPSRFMAEISAAWKRTLDDIPADAYISDDGIWETWDDYGGRGSGITTHIRFATREEVRFYQALAEINNFISEAGLK